ncbi:YbjN domain-containing protein, partial [Stenotrophomonas maltophilia]|uniref:YbjN domain-containing protein n=1 Tax=Stenotrophomonas maltophilia TaxID=40324 RepID=UPI0034564555
CEAHKQCASLQFSMRLTPSERRDLNFVNKWNSEKRFGPLALTKDGDLRLTHDMSTVGGITRANFTDVVEWWSSTMGTLETFL